MNELMAGDRIAGVALTKVHGTRRDFDCLIECVGGPNLPLVIAHHVLQNVRDEIQTALDADQAVELSFEEALGLIKRGVRLRREGWKGMYVELQVPDEHSKMTRPYVYLVYPDDTPEAMTQRVPWAPSQSDILATDWRISRPSDLRGK